MDSAGALIAAVVVAIGLLAGAGVVQYSLSNSGAEQAYTETFDPGTNQTHITLNESNQDAVYYSSTVNVTGENQSVMRPGVDYEWHESNGTLTVLDGGDLEGDSQGTVAYSVRIPSQQQKSYATLLGSWIDISYALPLVFIIVVLVAALSVFGGLS